MAVPTSSSLDEIQELLLLPTFLETLVGTKCQGRPQLHGLASACRELKKLVSKVKELVPCPTRYALGSALTRA